MKSFNTIMLGLSVASFASASPTPIWPVSVQYDTDEHRSMLYENIPDFYTVLDPYPTDPEEMAAVPAQHQNWHPPRDVVAATTSIVEVATTTAAAVSTPSSIVCATSTSTVSKAATMSGTVIAPQASIHQAGTLANNTMTVVTVTKYSIPESTSLATIATDMAGGILGLAKSLVDKIPTPTTMMTSFTAPPCSSSRLERVETSTDCSNCRGDTPTTMMTSFTAPSDASTKLERVETSTECSKCRGDADYPVASSSPADDASAWWT